MEFPRKDTNMSTLFGMFYEESDEWNLLGFKFGSSFVENNQGANYSLVRVDLALNRKTAKYGLTLLFPIICLNVLVCVGMWMPVSGGESIGFQITVLLSMVVYLDVLSRTELQICSAEWTELAEWLRVSLSSAQQNDFQK